MKNIKVLAIVGPTASGKSALAVRLARRFGGEIISADSRQVYRGLDIGTGKITKREMYGIPHHLLDVADPRQQYSAGVYAKAAQKIVRYIVQKNKLPIIVGGTGFYIDAALGTIVLPEVPPNQKLRKELTKKTSGQLFTMLQKLDPSRAKAIDRQNPVRLIRAIEIAKVLGHVPKHSNILQNVGMFDVLKIGLELSEKKLKARIEERLKTRIRRGMVAEAKRLHAQGLPFKRMGAFGIEYRYLAQYLQGKISKEEMCRYIDTESWQYAKRQIRWFKRDASIIWISPKDIPAAISRTQHWLQPKS